jgi:hypothetical protein
MKKDIEQKELEHLPSEGTRFSTPESEYGGFCPRCLMTEEEASEKPCFIPGWLKQYQSELEQAVREEIKQEINKIELALSENDKKRLEGESAEFGMGYGQTWLLNKINKLLEPEPANPPPMKTLKQIIQESDKELEERFSPEWWNGFGTTEDINKQGIEAIKSHLHNSQLKLLEAVKAMIEVNCDSFLLQDWSGEQEVYEEIKRLKKQLLSSLELPDKR